jgi:DNA helicase-2/ATP-dependent DNA helicase PcrA
VRLTDQQRAVVDAEGNFLLLACPGSGKTRSAAERVSRLSAAPGTKVAVCSYTNVGADRLSAVLRDDLRVILGPEHFLGTIHAFLIRYVLAPFGHLFGGEAHPVIRTDDDWPDLPVYGDPKQRVRLDHFRRAPDDSLVLPQVPRGVQGTPEEVIASVGARVRDYKKNLFFKHGLLTADDAMWATMKILQRRPDIARSVASRFDELLLDEAQDTSELQLECLKVLHATGSLRSLVLVGDLEQSIFSFQGASAEGCRNLAKDCGLELMELTENHRSSQRICDVAVHFCTREKADTAVGPEKDCDIVPELIVYPHKDPASTIDVFRDRLALHDIPVTETAVLARGHAIIEQLNGETTPKEVKPRHALIGLLAVASAAGTLTRHHVRSAQRLISDSAWGIHPDQLDDQQRAEARAAGHALLLGLPPLTGDLRQFMLNARAALGEVVSTIVAKPKSTAGQLLPAGPRMAEHDAAAVFAPPVRDLAARTVHSFKGEDSDAVMVVVRRFHASDPTSQMELFRAVVTGEAVAPEKEEERRVMFVALTRARRYCLVALPDDRHGRDVAGQCANLGFAIVTM